MNPRAQDTYTQAYNAWVTTRSPEAMAELVNAFMPTINAELQLYAGSRELLRSRAKAYVVQAIRSYNPMGNTKLNTWVTTNLKQLSRYGKSLRPVHASEDMLRNAAELSRVSAELEDQFGRKPTDEELQDETGWSKATLTKIRAASVASVSTGSFAQDDEQNGQADPSVVQMDELPFKQDAVYQSLNSKDRDIYDYKLGLHGKPALSGKDIASKLGVTPAYVSQRASAIGTQISEI